MLQIEPEDRLDALHVEQLEGERPLTRAVHAPPAILAYGTVQFDTRDSARDAAVPQAFREIARRLAHAPGVRAVALARMAPLQFGVLPFYPDLDTARFVKPFATYNLVSRDYFSATGMRLLSGSDFPRDRESMPPVVIVNDAMARAQWPGMNALGRCLRFAHAGQCYRVIGIVETAFGTRLLESAQPQFYLPLDNPPLQAGRWFSTVFVRTAPGMQSQTVATLRRVLREAFVGGRPVVSTMEQVLEPQYRPWRLGAQLFMTLGVLALILAAVGVAGTVTCTVAARTHEFGVRVALGALPAQVFRHVVVASLKPVSLGVVVGVVLALLTGRAVVSLLYGVGARDPSVLVAAAGVMLTTAAAAALRPAARAARMNPVDVLRTE